MKNKLGITALAIALFPIVLFFVLPLTSPLSATDSVEISTYLVFIILFIFLAVTTFVLSTFALRRENEKKVFPILAIIMILLPIIAVGTFMYQDYRTAKIVSHWETYTNNEYGFKINYNGKWSAINTSDKNMPLQLKHSSGCMLSYGKLDTEALSSNYDYHLDESTRDFFEKETKDIYLSDSYFRITSFWQRNQNGGGTKNIGVYINHFPQKDSQNSLVLHENGLAIDGDCTNDFLALLTSGINLSSSLYSITPESNGLIQTEVIFNSVGFSGDPQWAKTKTVLIFKDQGGDKEVMAYLDLYSNSEPQMQLVGNKAYFVDLYGQLSSIDLLSKQIESIDLPGVRRAQKSTLPDDVINDFFIYKDILYYLSGENCNYYMADCRLTLWQYDLVSKQGKILAENIDFPSIVGYDPALNKLYMRWTFGDAGAYAIKIKEYDFKNGQVRLVAAISHGQEDFINTPDDQKIEALYERLKNQLGRLSGITVAKGQVVKNQTISSNEYVGIRYIQN